MLTISIAVTPQSILAKCSSINVSFINGFKVRIKAKIRNQYNQVTRLAKDTIWESDKISRYITHTRAKRSGLSEQETTRLQGTDKTV